MNIGEYIDRLEERIAVLKTRWLDAENYQLIFQTAAVMLPAARKSIADLFIAMDKLDKALKPFEA